MGRDVKLSSSPADAEDGQYHIHHEQPPYPFAILSKTNAMETVTGTITRRLRREEAKRRIRDQVVALRGEAGGLITSVEVAWTVHRMAFRVRATGQSVSGDLSVDDSRMLVEVALPWLLKMLSGSIKQQIERQCHLLLGTAA